MAGDRTVMNQIQKVLFDSQIFNYDSISEYLTFFILRVRNFLDQFT